MADEYVILVDENDSPLGLEEKVRCHLPDGKLHRAFTALLFDPAGRLLLTRRSSGKMLWPSHWDGTFASHPRESETYASSAQRRMPEEVGASYKMDYMFKFEYHVPYMDVGSENEICGVLAGATEAEPHLEPVADEISEVKWITADELSDGMREDPHIYCPWMLIALYLLPSSDGTMIKRHAGRIGVWTGEALRAELKKAIGVHLPEHKWRLVS